MTAIEDLPPLGDRDLDVLQVIVEERPRIIHVIELEGRAGCRETVCKSLRVLTSAGLVRRPRGRNGGVIPEPLGVDVIRQLRPEVWRRLVDRQRASDEEPTKAA